MTAPQQARPWKAVAAIVAVGVVLAAAILSWKTGPAASGGAGHADAPAASAPSGAPAADEVVRLDAAQIARAGIAFAVAGPATIATSVRLPGEVRFDDDRTAHVVPRLPGVAEAVPARLGQSVRKGQVLAVISSPQLAEMRSTLDAARTRLALARTLYEREKTLWQDRISAEQDYLQAHQAWQEAEIAVRNAESKLTALGVAQGAEPAGALNRYALRAPFDGMIVEKHISLGEAVKEDANVFLLSDLARVWVDVIVTPRDLDAVRVGADARVTAAATGASATGRVAYVGALVGEQTRSASARVELPNPGLAWRPGLFVDVELAQAPRQVVVAVPAAALQTVEDRTVVFVRGAQGLRARQVTVGAADGRFAEIRAGLRAGETVAAAGSFVLKAEQGKDGADHGH
ncbi:efflux RND transporter periplasmic adaptor subunit [uncultured Massilia sp.]|uniref:efflux RND transporter periplasmic adaptor subunit n=1 Tax=uncultured Massilia sp. TaxID=169973 RepID=UPI0025F5CB6D|nr:efflux RND transporter periplasmic adaptor subunit [uncultured Massilia sp.]